jgi:hypothetical protein
MDRELLQIRERGIAGPEVVDRQLDTQVRKGSIAPS